MGEDRLSSLALIHTHYDMAVNLNEAVLGQRPLNNPPVLIPSSPEETPGPSSAAGDCDEDEPAPTPGKKKWGCEDELVELPREDIKFQQLVTPGSTTDLFLILQGHDVTNPKADVCHIWLRSVAFPAALLSMD
ncbi:hypothetical protein QQF64_024076 [Cirrhinus molitorella]|uniref:Uncharacterized protein n=1 Tax=Cirrhinus molitorella TaxID=172907 RepID=A0ABR3NL51_9TELE